MTSTTDLLKMALEKKTASEWARLYNLTPGTFTNAKTRGRLSPVLAGNIAIDLGENPDHWMAVAAIEAERESPLRDRLRASLLRIKSYLFTHPKRYTF